MEDGYIGEIRMFAGNFAPRSWYLCAGQLISIADNQALFSILGTFYGGDGRTTFGLPDFRGVFPIGFGTSQRSHINYNMGAIGGNEQSYVQIQNLPPHHHPFYATSDLGNQNDPTSALLGNTGTFDKEYIRTTANLVPMSDQAIGNTGGGQPINNMPPFQAINFIICSQGLYPSRS